MRSFSGYVAPVRKEDRVKVVATGQPQQQTPGGNSSSNKMRVCNRFPSWCRKPGRTIRGWFTGCLGHREEAEVYAVGEPLLYGGEEQEQEDAEGDKKLMWEERTEVFVPRHAALVFLKRTTKRRSASMRNRKGQRGTDAAMYG